MAQTMNPYNEKQIRVVVDSNYRRIEARSKGLREGDGWTRGYLPHHWVETPHSRDDRLVDRSPPMKLVCGDENALVHEGKSG